MRASMQQYTALTAGKLYPLYSITTYITIPPYPIGTMPRAYEKMRAYENKTDLKIKDVQMQLEVLLAKKIFLYTTRQPIGM